MDRLCLMIVEDDADTRDVLKELIELEGHEARVATCVTDAARQLEAGLRPNVIILDERLPDGLGSDLIADLRRRPELSQVPVVLLSAAAPPPVEDATILTLRKPLHIDTLLRAIRDMNGATRGWHCAAS